MIFILELDYISLLVKILQCKHFAPFPHIQVFKKTKVILAYNIPLIQMALLCVNLFVEIDLT